MGAYKTHNAYNIHTITSIPIVRMLSYGDLNVHLKYNGTKRHVHKRAINVSIFSGYRS